MRTLTLRIYLTVLVVLLLFALTSGWLFQRGIDQERVRAQSVLSDRMAAWGDLIQRSLPPPEAPPAEQARALLEWSDRLRLPLALDSERQERIVASESFQRRQSEEGVRAFEVKLEDGRTLWLIRPGFRRLGEGGPGLLPFLPRGLSQGVGVLFALLVLFAAISAAAWPVVRALTRRLESLKRGVETFGAGQLSHRVEVSGRDEVAAVAASFNDAAARIEALVRSHQSLLANASHELRSPLARMKMAVSLLEDAPAEQRSTLKREIDTNVAELDALVEEVLLASRLDAVQGLDLCDLVDLRGLAAEEAARMNLSVDVAQDAVPITTRGDERLLRRALRNLLENAGRYGGPEVSIQIERLDGRARVQVCDRGPGVPAEYRDRIFEPFYRLPGHAEKAGGVGLGLSLVRQIAQRHAGTVRCEARQGGGSCFVLSLPLV